MAHASTMKNQIDLARTATVAAGGARRTVLANTVKDFLQRATSKIIKDYEE